MPENQGKLFSADPHPEEQTLRLMRCLKRDVLFRNGGNDWREVQANLGMAALLMPRPVFRAVTNQEIKRLALPCRKVKVGSSTAELLAAQVAARFTVSRQAALIRFETLGIVSPAGHQRLL
jgi:Zn-dependent peptidase ImmA (M78 family)